MSRNLTIAIVCVILIAVLTLASASGIGFSTSEEIASSVKLSDIMKEVQSDIGFYPQYVNGPIVYTKTFMNVLLPRQVLLPRVSACLYNNDGFTSELTTRWVGVMNSRNAFSSEENIMQLGFETKTVQLMLLPQSGPRVPKPTSLDSLDIDKVDMTIPVLETFDELYLIFNERTDRMYRSCYDFNPGSADVVGAIKIQIIKD